ncbi:chromosome segregation protein SMC [Ferruginivarius sediminum]|uniref:Chromosome partition protein Smc n=1 Tax=Ferruginivarius sediminum TaxID=2661937 RepID=A0A369T9R7_9PROT|nr:chromosome segregation protein SMC [Ferruginivarius sediminum]RDD61125.1 chromosome segregation protein SMC [Ferruginivarius sediminum]
MQFTRLRLRGFKSFVDPAELVIEPGMTGIVGPNGCGKSNLVEALRWVMGETSAKRMRGGEMDDVIFAGSSRRPSHNLAEVALNLDNGSRTAPAQFNEMAELDVVRRIERDKGSTYRVNGREVRARDVQLLFADQATGANSTALVSQGRIGHIINAKPAERRHLLEEAAGIGGLHSRRHEAELRLRAAESNLERLDDVISTLETQLQTLQRQARQAKRYRRITEQMRRNEAIVLHLEAEAAKQRLADAREGLKAAQDRVAELTQTTSSRSTEQAEAQAALPPLREAEAAAAAELQRLQLALQGLEQEERQVEQARKQAEDRLHQIEGDRQRTQAQVDDATAAIERLDAEKAELQEATAGEDEAKAAARRVRDDAQEAEKAAEGALGELNQRLAADEAQAKALDKRILELTQRLDRLRRQADDVARQKAELAARDDDGTRALEQAAAAIESADATLTQARESAEAAEADLAAAREKENETRAALQAAQGERDRLQAEIDALAGLLEQPQEEMWTPLLESVRARTGSETALGAALGDDLNAPADSGAPVHWLELPPLDTPPPLPDGATSLADVVKAPKALDRRLRQVGVVEDRETGERLQPALQPGQRLVTRDGGLWRWDGYVAAAEAPTAAAQRLQQHNRLTELREQLPDLEAGVESAKARHEEAEAATHEAVERERAARQAVNTAYAEVDRARTEHNRLEKAAAEARSRRFSLDESAERLAGDVKEAEESKAQAEADKAALPDLAALRSRANDQRAALAERRAGLSQAQGELDRVEREAKARGERLLAIGRERQSWQSRADNAHRHLAELDERARTAQQELDDLAAKPAELAEKRKALSDSIAAAEAKRGEAADALAAGETRLAEADKALKAEEQRLGEAREARVRAESAVEQAETALQTVKERVDERLECPLERVLEQADLDPGQELPAREEAERTLQRLTRERDNIGPVNLRAEVEAEEMEQQIAGMQSEREDLTAAIQRLRQGIASLNREGRERLLAAFEQVNEHFAELFVRLFGGGRAHLSLTESDDPLAAGLEIMASPPGKRLQVMSLLSGGEQALTALSLLFAVFLTNPAPICVLDEVDAPLDDANVDRFCTLVDELAREGTTRFLVITHHRMTMSRMDRLFGVTMSERGVSQLVSVDLTAAESLREIA